jgi:hypothetical protein
MGPKAKISPEEKSKNIMDYLSNKLSITQM